MTKKKKIDSDAFLSIYMSFVEKNKRYPKNFEAFLKKHQVTKGDLKDDVKSFKELDRHIFYLFHSKALALLEQSEDYINFNAKNKLLSFYYTYFELLGANEGYVKTRIKKDTSLLKTASVLKKFKTSFYIYIDGLPIEKFELFDRSLNKFQRQFLQTAGWVQFMSLLKFWLHDRSTAYEKTDVLIEKLVNTSFDVINIKPVLSVVDLGKFIIKEKMKGKK